MKENIPQYQLREILKEQYGVIFFPKRTLKIPIIDETKLKKLVGEKRLGPTKERLRTLLLFLHSEAVGDSFGSDHKSRVNWVNEMFDIYGEPFLELHQKNNQFRLNILSYPILTIVNLSYLVKNQDIKQMLLDIERELGDAINGSLTGRSYNDTDSLEDKLKVVHFFEDKTIEVLGLMNGSITPPIPSWQIWRR